MLIAQIPSVRQDIDRLRIPRKDALGFYTDFNEQAIGLVGYIAAGVTDPEIVRELLTYRALMLGKDFAGLDRAIGASGFAVGAFGTGTRQQLIELRAKQSTYFDYVLSYASPAEQEKLNAVLNSQTASDLSGMREIALTGNSDQIAANSASSWFDKQTAQIGELKALEDTMAEAISQTIVERVSAAQTAALIASGLLLVGLGVAGWMSLRFIASIKRRIDGIVEPLDQLANGNLDVVIPDHSGTEFEPVTNAMRVFKDSVIAKQEDERERDKVLSVLRDNLTE